MLFHSLHLRNVLSFKDAEIDLEPLNIIIGPNASGKSNLLGAVSLLQAVPDDLPRFFRINGPILDWIWKGGAESRDAFPQAETKAVLENPVGRQEAERQLAYFLQLGANNERMQVIDERLENIRPTNLTKQDLTFTSQCIVDAAEFHTADRRTKKQTDLQLKTLFLQRG